jgi:hypothetical protein
MSDDVGDSNKPGGIRKDSTKEPFHYQGKRRAFKKPTHPPRQPKFEGKCDDLKGHIYDCSSPRQVDLFAKTTKEIAEYVGRSYRYGTDVQRAIQEMALPILRKPVDPPDQASKTDSAIWSNEVSTYVKRRAGMEEGLEKVFPLILGQCTDSMRSKLEGFDTYATISGSFDTIKLLKLIKTTHL